jgi:hypothetical protein
MKIPIPFILDCLIKLLGKCNGPVLDQVVLSLSQILQKKPKPLMNIQV